MSTGVFRLNQNEEMRCEDVRLAMGEVLDGVAELSVKLSVEAHVRQCPPCATEMNEMREVVEGVKKLSDMPPKPEAWPPVERAAGGSGQLAGGSGQEAGKAPPETNIWDKFRKFFGK